MGGWKERPQRLHRLQYVWRWRGYSIFQAIIMDEGNVENNGNKTDNNGFFSHKESWQSYWRRDTLICHSSQRWKLNGEKSFFGTQKPLKPLKWCKILVNSLSSMTKRGRFLSSVQFFSPYFWTQLLSEMRLKLDQFMRAPSQRKIWTGWQCTMILGHHDAKYQ